VLTNRTVATVLLAGIAACAPTPSTTTPAQAPTATICAAAKKDETSTFGLSVLGSGGPASTGRAASGYVVSIDGTPRILIDAGPGAFVRLGEMGINLEHLDTILLTHLHIDHAGDVPGFVKSRDLSYGHPLTFRFFGPEAGGTYPSTRAFLETLFGAQGAFGYLPAFRNQLTLEPHDLPIRADAPMQELVRDKGLLITSIAVDHGDVPAVAYRIEHDGYSVVVSGDLASKADNLVVLARGADLLVYDAAVLDPPGSPAGLYALHTAPKRIGEVAAAARVRRLLLSHLSPAVAQAQDTVLRSISASYTGPVRFATDCMAIDVTSRAPWNTAR